MMRRLNQGRHPDTDRDFWNGFRDTKAPDLPGISVPEQFKRRLALRQNLSMVVLIGVPSLGIAFVFGLKALRSTRRRAHAKVRHRDQEFA